MNSDRLSVFDDVYNKTHQLLSGQPVVVVFCAGRLLFGTQNTKMSPLKLLAKSSD